MNEDRKKRGLANSNLLIAMAITTLIIGSSNAMANQTASGSSYKVTEQMQIQTVTGVVVDANGEPIIGASVFIPGTSIGVATDLDGNYVLKVPANTKNIEFSYIGYEKKVVPFNPKDLNVFRVVTMKEDSGIALEDVTIVAFAKQKKESVLGSVSTIKPAELKTTSSNLTTGFAGKLAGVVAYQRSGEPGEDNAEFFIRGVTSFGYANSPLILIDGLEVTTTDLARMEPDNIASFSIMKDATATALYGARGANGVVLITTKKGTKGKATLNYEFTYGIQNPSKKVDLLGSADYQMLMNEMAANAGKDPYFPTVSSVNTDWQKELQNKNAPIMNHKVSLSGGTDNSTYYASFGYVKQEGIYAKGHADYERYNVRLNYNNVLLDTKSRNWLNKISFGAIASYSKSIQTGNTIGNSEAAGLITSMNMLPPTEPVYQTDPAILEQYAVTYPNHVIAPNGLAYNIIEMREITNPLAAMQVSHNQRTMPQNFGANFNLDVDLLPGLKFKTTYGAEWVFNSIKNVTPVYELNATSKNATSKVEDKKRESSYWQWENVLSYTKSFGRHNIGALFGTSMSSYHYSNLEAEDYNLLVVDIDKGYIDTATAPEEQSKVWGGAEDHRIASVFGRINYNYDEKYLFEAVVRRDGSSNFSREHQYATFPSVSLGWVLTREKFMENRPSWLDFAKIRLSWGQNGNERIGSFAYTSMMSQGKNAVINGKVYTGMLPSGYANADLKWETSEQTDLGIDLRFFNSALTFSADYFVKKTKDMLLSMPIPLYTSYGSMTVNSGTVKNEGIEFEASYRFKVGEVNLGINGNASYVKNTVTDQGPDRVGLNNIGGGMGGQVSWRENGRPYGFFYGYLHDGIFQNQQEIDSYTYVDSNGKTQLIQPNAKPGDIRFKDLDGKNGLNGDDRTMIGKPNPDWTYGFTLSADWKGLDFSAFFQGSIGNDIYKLYRRSNVTFGNYDKSWLNRWHGEGTSNWVPRVIDGDNNNYQVSNFFVEDGSYMRLKVLQIGYSLPGQMLQRVGVKGLRFFVQGENLFTITNYSGYDPEVGTRDGFDGGTYPQARTYTIGANITF